MNEVVFFFLPQRQKEILRRNLKILPLMSAVVLVEEGIPCKFD